MSEPLVFTLDQLTGRTREHLTEMTDPTGALHRAVVSPFLTLRAAAAADGIDLVAFSSFRDFDRQLTLWNAKFRGERPALDRDGQPVDMARLAPAERVQTILWWSALPGASRHHWGTDFDVFDAAAVPAGYRLQVVPAEYQPGGPFHRLTTWLDQHMHRFGFYRPYAQDRGGVMPEPWHLSHAAVAAEALAHFRLEEWRALLATVAIEGKAEVLASLDEYYARYVVNVDGPPVAALLCPRVA